MSKLSIDYDIDATLVDIVHRTAKGNLFGIFSDNENMFEKHKQSGLYTYWNCPTNQFIKYFKDNFNSFDITIFENKFQKNIKISTILNHYLEFLNKHYNYTITKENIIKIKKVKLKYD